MSCMHANEEKLVFFFSHSVLKRVPIKSPCAGNYAIWEALCVLRSIKQGASYYPFYDYLPPPPTLSSHTPVNQTWFDGITLWGRISNQSSNNGEVHIPKRPKYGLLKSLSNT